MTDSDQVAELEARNAHLVETLVVTRNMLLEIRSEVVQVEARERFNYLLKQRRWRLRSVQQQLM